MLLLAHAAIPGGFEVATVNHGLRAASAGECRMVHGLCAQLAIPCNVLAVEVVAGNLQANARAARYRALEGWARQHGLGAVATAHQSDDQAETFLMRLARGSGVAGLAAIRARGTVPDGDMPLLRPLLGFTREECEGIVAGAGLDPVRDPSNEDQRFDRVRMRQWLAASPLLSAEAVRASAANCADAADALRWAAEREWAERVEQGDREIRYRPQAPRAIALLVAERAVRQLGGQPRGTALADLLDRLESGQGGNLAGVMARPKNGEWIFTPEPERRPA